MNEENKRSIAEMRKRQQEQTEKYYSRKALLMEMVRVLVKAVVNIMQPLLH
jgi:hypothetical protein